MRYAAPAVQPGKAMTVKEMRPTVATRWTFFVERDCAAGDFIEEPM
jgi:hypothetical protein